MGQTLTHGVYLPDEGERNCYSGLAANWQLLDGAVGTVAAHTTALSGKAPLVHTHTKADITDFPAYGTTAGTICEGNDSRLSDARTPVAHTHTKSDVTDLLNSNFIPSANNAYDLGSSSYQWNNLYAKNYYYNGTAWGLDKTNVWSGENTYTNILLTLKHTALEVGVLPASNQTRRYRFADKNNANLGWVQHRVNTSGDSYIEIYSVNRFSDGQYSPQGSDIANSLIVGLHSDGTRYAQIMSNFVPAYTNLNCNLGTSTNKWKTLNGINPGALSFPEGTTDNANTTFNPDLTDWLRDGTAFTITAQVTGWLHIRIKNSTGNFAWVKRGTAGVNQTWGIVGNSDTNSDIVDISLNVPVIQNYAYTLKIKSSTLYAAIFMCLGNV